MTRSCGATTTILPLRRRDLPGRWSRSCRSRTALLSPRSATFDNRINRSYPTTNPRMSLHNPELVDRTRRSCRRCGSVRCASLLTLVRHQDRGSGPPRSMSSTRSGKVVCRQGMVLWREGTPLRPDKRRLSSRRRRSRRSTSSMPPARENRSSGDQRRSVGAAGAVHGTHGPPPLGRQARPSAMTRGAYAVRRVAPHARREWRPRGTSPARTPDRRRSSAPPDRLVPRTRSIPPAGMQSCACPVVPRQRPAQPADASTGGAAGAWLSPFAPASSPLHEREGDGKELGKLELQPRVERRERLDAGLVGPPADHAEAGERREMPVGASRVAPPVPRRKEVLDQVGREAAASLPKPAASLASGEAVASDPASWVTVTSGSASGSAVNESGPRRLASLPPGRSTRTR